MEPSAPPPRNAALGRGPWPWLGAALAVAVAGLAIDALAFGARARAASSDLLQLGAGLAAALACLVSARKREGATRKGWLLFAAALGVYAACQAIRTWHEVVRGVPVPVPSAADLGLLAMYPLAGGALLMLSPLRGRGTRVRLSLLLDAVLSTLAVYAIAWPALDIAIDNGRDARLVQTAILYPLADILLLGLAGGILMRGRDAVRSGLGLVYAGLFAIMLGDLLWSITAVQGAYMPGQAVDVAWPVGFLLLAAAARARVPDPLVPARPYTTRIGHVLPVVGVVAALVSFGLVVEAREHTHPMWQWLLTALVAAAMARQALSHREVAALELERSTVQSRYDSLFEHMAEGFAHCRMLYEGGAANDWEYLRVNENFARLTGLHDVVGRRVSALIPGIRASNPELFELYGQAAAGRSPPAIESEIASLGIWFRVTAYPIAPGEFAVVFDNITERKRVQAEHQRLHEQYMSLVESAAEGLLETRMDGTLVFANGAAAALFGFPSVAALQAQVGNVLALYEDAGERERVLRHVRSGDRAPCVARMRHRDGRTLLVSVRIHAVTHKDGVHLQGLFVDETERHAQEAALRASEARLREAQQVAHLGSWEQEHQGGALGGSDEFRRIFEAPAGAPLSFDDLVGRLHPDDRERVVEAYRASVASGGPFVAEYRLAFADGRIKHIVARGRTERDGQGTPLRSVGTVLDVTELKQMQQTLTEAQAANRRLIEESPLAIVRVTPEGHFLAANPAALRIYGVPDLAALQGLSARDLYVEPEERPARVAQAEQAKGLFTTELQLRRPDGSPFWIRSHSRAVRDEAGVAYFEAIVEDITEQRAAEKALEALAARDREVKRLEELNKMRMEFLNTAAHDLKTPLTPLKLQMATLRMGDLGVKHREALDLMDRSVNRFQALIDDMLDAARLQAGRLNLKRSSVRLAPAVQEAVAAFQEAMRQSGLKLDVRVDPAVTIDADPNKLMQVLMNLVSNAVKYTPKEGSIQVRAEERDGAAHLSVRDTGLGMDADQMSRLFQPFVRLHEAIPGTAKGTGLGLYISKGIAEWHGGRLWAESDGPGHGSTFHLAWPLAKQVTPAPGADSAARAA